MKNNAYLTTVFSIVFLSVMIFLNMGSSDSQSSSADTEKNNNVVVVAAETTTVTTEAKSKTTKTKRTTTKTTKTTSCRTTKTTTTKVSTKTSKAVENSAAVTTTTVTATTSAEPLFLDINTADRSELVMLNGIGEVLADAVVDFRETQHPFRNIEEIMLVSGIGEKKFQLIRDNIYVENPVYEEAAEPPTEAETVPTEPETTQPEVPETTETTAEIPEEVTTLPEDEPAEIVPVELNTALLEDFCTLPYVTEEKALKIIELREKISRFSHPYELLYVEELERYQVSEIIKHVYISDAEETTEEISE